MTDRIPEASRALVYERAKRLVADDRARVLVLRARPRWTHGDLIVGEATVKVRPAVSQLAALDALSDRGNDYLILLTDRDELDIGDVVVVQAEHQRIEALDEWAAIPPLYAATSLDPALRQAGSWVPRALLDYQPADGWPAAPTGVVTADHALGALLARLLGVSRLGDLGTLLAALDTPDGRAAWQRVPDDVRAGVIAWARGSGLGEPAAMALAAARRGPVSTAALGLALDVLWSVPLDPEQAAARGRIESHVEGRSIRPEAARAYAAAARAEVLRADEAGDTFVPSVLAQAEALLKDVGWAAGIARSTILPGGLTARLHALAELMRPDASALAADLQRIEGALRDLLVHERADSRAPVIVTARMAVRLVRWVVLAPERRVTLTLGQALQDYVEDGAWADRAAAVLWDGADDPVVAAAYRGLLDLVRPLRRQQDETAAHLLADATARDEPPAGAVLIERVLPDVVWPMPTPTMVILLDGMSVPVALELVEDIVGDWTEIVPESGRRLPVLAALPTVTKYSRTAFFTGELAEGGQATEVAAMRTRFGAALVHKDGLRSPAGESLPRSVRELIDGDTRMVAVVLNTIDDALAKHDPGGTRWDVGDIQYLRALLNAAALAGRSVVLTSDHGHVVERGSEARPVTGADARWRAAAGRVASDEVVVRGRRVVPGEAVLPWSEDLRYASLRSGYHGGASLAEITVPLMVLTRAGQHIAGGWRAAPPQAPTWWHEASREPMPGGRRAHRDSAGPRMDFAHARPVARPAASAPGQGTLGFEVITPPRAVAGSLTERLVNSDVLAGQLRRAGRGAPTAEAVASVVSALMAGGNRAHRDTLAAVLGVPSASFPLAVLSRVLNVEGYPVIRMDPDGTTVHLDEALLREQFDLGRADG